MNNLYAQRYRAGMSITWQVALGISGLIAVAITAGMGGYWYSRLNLLQAYEFQLKALGEGPHANKLGLLGSKSPICNSEIDSISLKLAQFQAEILRINALGERLVEKAGLSHDEFDFQSLPPQGGPEVRQVFQQSRDSLDNELDILLAEMQDKGHKLTLLEHIIMEKELHNGSLIILRPVTAGYISSYFGHRKDPFHGGSSFHAGVDYAAKLGSPILAVADGVITGAGIQDGYGKVLDVQHFNGLVTRYAHCQKINVGEGELVQKGQIIATVGSSGRSTGPHLHFEVLKNDVRFNPLRYVSSK